MYQKTFVRLFLSVLFLSASFFSPLLASAIDFEAGRVSISSGIPSEKMSDTVVIQTVVWNAFNFLSILVVLLSLVAIPLGIYFIVTGSSQKTKTTGKPIDISTSPDNIVDYAKFSTWFGLSGRIGRLWYVGITLGSIILTLAMFGGFGVFLPMLGTSDTKTYSLLLFLFAGFIMLMLAGLLWWFRVSACVRRLHDIGSSGWCYLMVFIPFLGGLISLVLFCVLAFMKGTPQKNIYGASKSVEI